jgi:lipopolysaccharide/colanic/teichoic acid biosynthesis glycosyltransferase
MPLTMKTLLLQGTPPGPTQFRPPPFPELPGLRLDTLLAAGGFYGSRAPVAGKPSSRIPAQPSKACQPSADLTPIMSVAQNPLPFWKRFIDLACCAVALPVLALCTLIMVIVTKCVSPGPVFFRQERIGHLGRRFKIYKFRTMRVGADTSVHQSHYKDLIGTNAPMAKLDASGDARLIPGAWLLRASGLDELPQFINVLRGEMSLVGPRPCIPFEYQQYKPAQRKRCNAMPGLTGLWQVSGKNRTTFEQMIRFDIQYAQDVSLWLDLKIIFLTAPSLLVQIYDTRVARRSTAQPVNSSVPSTALRAPYPSQLP